MRPPSIQPLHLADVTLPEGHPLAGGRCPVYAFLIRHPEGTVLVDTGLGSHDGIDRRYRPVRRSLVDALAGLGLRPADVVAVVNTHLHFDHCGQNELFAGRPLLVQAKEYEAGHEPFYTVLEWVDFPGARYRLLDGRAEVLPGVLALPTHGHTPGHQAIVVEFEGGRDVIAGQAAYDAREFAGGEAADPGAAAQGLEEQYRASLRLLHELAPRRVYFSHDHTRWEAPSEEG